MTQKNNKTKGRKYAMVAATKVTPKGKAKDDKKKSTKGKDEAQAFLDELEKKKEASPDTCVFC